MKKRIITGIGIAAVIVPAVYFGGIFFLLVGMFLSVVASYEMMSMFYRKGPALKNYRFLVPILSALIVLIIYFAATEGLDPNVLQNNVIEGAEARKILYHFWVTVVFVASIILCLGALIFTKNSTAHDMMACVLTLCYTGLIMGYVISIEYIAPVGFSELIENRLYGGRSFTFLFAIVVATDMVAYFIGIKFGKHKLAPEISPKKSVEGGIAGLIAGGVAGLIVAFVFPIVVFSPEVDTWGKITVVLVILLFAVIISATVQIGDLVASKLKRSYEIKDFGKIFPGHGGVLDRFDSLIFAGAVYYVIAQFIQLVVLGVNHA